VLAPDKAGSGVVALGVDPVGRDHLPPTPVFIAGMHARHGARPAAPGGFLPPQPTPGQGAGAAQMGPGGVGGPAAGGWPGQGQPGQPAAGPGGFGAPPPQQPKAPAPMMPLMNDATAQIATTVGLSYGEKMMAWGRTRMGWFTGEGFFYLFNLDGAYVAKKLLRLLFPWTVGGDGWARVKDPHSDRFLPPRSDVNAPDLYLPIVSLALMVVLHAVEDATSGVFVPATAHSDATWFLLTWLTQYAMFYFLMRLGAEEQHGPNAGYLQTGQPQRGGALTHVRQTELIAYAGYIFTFAALPSLVALLGNRALWMGACLYAWLSLSKFMLKALEQLRMSAHQMNSQTQNYAFFIGLIAELFILWLVAIKPVPAAAAGLGLTSPPLPSS